MVDYLKSLGFVVGRILVRKLMALMDIKAIYLMKNLSKCGWMKYRMPYLLRHLDIAHPNHVWSTDISYIAMEHGFMYLYAIIDVYSRYIVGWAFITHLMLLMPLRFWNGRLRSMAHRKSSTPTREASTPARRGWKLERLME